jgi:hypothetical protein
VVSFQVSFAYIRKSLNDKLKAPGQCVGDSSKMQKKVTLKTLNFQGGMMRMLVHPPHILIFDGQNNGNCLLFPTSVWRKMLFDLLLYIFCTHSLFSTCMKLIHLKFTFVQKQGMLRGSVAGATLLSGLF